VLEFLFPSVTEYTVAIHDNTISNQKKLNSVIFSIKSYLRIELIYWNKTNTRKTNWDTRL